MTETLVQFNLRPEIGDRLIVNDLGITFCTINGSGSATANTAIMRALYKMGIPVSGRNIFPSNIQGQPTWFSLRASKEGYLGRIEKDDVVVAMNPLSFTQDIDFLVPGGVLIYADDIKTPIHRQDIIVYPVPVKKLIKDAETPNQLRDYIANMVYVGVVADLFNVDMDAVYQAIEQHFKGKKTAVQSNFSVIEAAWRWSRENLKKKDRYYLEAMHALDQWIMVDGNTAAALGSLYGGAQFVGWYPITPATTVVETMNEYVPKLRKDPESGKLTCAVVQAEDELAAIGMCVGAGWAGLRSMTSTSGPGLSLMAEYLGLAYFTEVPVVVWDVQRVGPSTGLPTRTAQGDLTQAYFHSHGDKDFVILFPATVQECFEFAWRAFDIAERLQTPVIVMSDLDLGMNSWITPAFQYPEQGMDRGKVLWEEDLEKWAERGLGEWGRYLDVDGDGIPYRTVAGNRHPKSGYFTRGTGHNEYAKYSENQEVWEGGLDRLKKKFETAKMVVPEPEFETLPGARIGVIYYGSTESPVKEARDKMKSKGVLVDLLRVKAIPFSDEVEKFIQDHDRTYVVEINRDGQMKQILTVNYPTLAARLRQAAHTDGMPLSARWICDAILEQEA